MSFLSYDNFVDDDLFLFDKVFLFYIFDYFFKEESSFVKLLKRVYYVSAFLYDDVDGIFVAYFLKKLASFLGVIKPDILKIFYFYFRNNS